MARRWSGHGGGILYLRSSVARAPPRPLNGITLCGGSTLILDFGRMRTLGSVRCTGPTALANRRAHGSLSQDCFRCLYSARWIAQHVAYRRPVLLWVTESGVWDSNWHLYYRLRQSYHDYRLIHEAPGHYFLDYESEDLSCFIQLVMVNGWDAYLLTEIDYINAFFSHDGFTDVFSDQRELVKEFCKNAGDSPAAE